MMTWDKELEVCGNSVTVVTGQNGSGQNGTEKNGMDKMVYGQNVIGQNGMHKMVRTNWYLTKWLQALEKITIKVKLILI